jgi:uncharacterized membrane protein YfcA
MPLVLPLAILVGLTLGLLGGGGSILTVPLLLFAGDMAPRVAIATSLLVVGLTSVAALWPHARAGNVNWRVGLLFAATAMIGGFGGGWVSQFIPAWVLLVAFSIMMLATAVAMLRSREEDKRKVRKSLPLHWIAVEGVLVGAITGMVGAGGGFLVVPALAVLGGLSMRTAIGTSLLVIAMKSAAAFVGYASHVAIDYGLALQISAASVVGALVGATLAKRISANALRGAFGWFVAIMGVYMLGSQLPASVLDSALFQAVFVERWPWWIGGAAIGLFVLGFLYVENKLVGVSTGFSELCTVPKGGVVQGSWRLRFLIGILFGGLFAGFLGTGTPSFALGSFDSLWGVGLAGKVGILLGAGVLIGFGARTAGGCTSGHSIVGVSLGARSSIIATVAFMVAGFAVTHLLVAII